jgi:type I restriction enzyme R subunit
VEDPESGEEPFTETSKVLNPGLRGRDIRETFKQPEYHILLVANKFQTGFDQPLLCGMYVDRRLAGIQAVQTLSRLNRAHPGKDTTYIVDFVNSADEILKAFKTYYGTAELDAASNPNLVFDLRAKLDAQGFYDDFEVNRVVSVELNPSSKQGDLVAALEPVADRVLKTYKQAQERFQVAQATENDAAAKDAREEMEVLILFKSDMQAFQRLYSFLSQIFDYGNTAIEARSIFYRRLIPLLEFGRDREGIDLSKVVLTHHNLKNQGKHTLPVGEGDKPLLTPLSDTGSGLVQERERALLAEIISKVNDLFQGDITDDDRLIYVNSVLKGKLLQSETLAQQAENNTKEQFSNSPDLKTAIMDAIMDAFAAHETMSKQALDSEKVREGLKDVLLGPGQLYERLRERGKEAV